MKRRVVSGLALSVVLAASSYGGELDGPGAMQGPQEAVMPRTVSPRTITIRIRNYAQVKPSVLNQATKAASDIFRGAGVDSVWVECSVGQTFLPDSSCSNPVTPLDLVLNLLPRSRTQNLHLRDEVLGMAMETTAQDFGAFASVFYDSVELCAAHRGLDLSHLLGHVIAHELGHLLLGANSHSGHGVMRACWSGKELVAAGQGGLSFSASEQHRLQTVLTARTQAASSGEESLE
jgi:hypothetical protein